jgi:hypothetical protein
MKSIIHEYPILKIPKAISKGLLTLLFIIFCVQAKAQKTTKPDTLQTDEMVLTPKGLRPKSTVHHIESGCHLSVENGHFKKIETKTGKVITDYGKVSVGTSKEKKNTTKKEPGSSSPGSITYGSAWITYAWWENNDANNPITYFSTNWIVPTAPTTNDGQTIFLFNGIQPGPTGDGILQPVLQWGPSAAGGEDYWAITNWYVADTAAFWGDSLITVTPGTNLQGIMVLTAKSGSSYNYNSSFVGYPNCSLQVNNVAAELTWANETMEVYGITQYSDYPPDTAVRMSAIGMNTGTVSAALHWTREDVSTEVGQHTLVPSNSSTNGEVDLYFHYPNRAGIISISVNPSNCIDTLVSPLVELQYHGSSTLTTCVLNYQIDAGSVQTYTWNGSLTTEQTANVNLPGSIAALGSHTITCYCSSANDSTNAYFLDSQSSATFHIGSENSLPFFESFESTTCPSAVLPNTNWNISHTAANGVDFIITAAAAVTGVKSCMINNLSNVANDTSILQTAFSYDITALTTPVLTFKAAYQQKATTNTDKLQLFTSTDCGNSWQSRKVFPSATLASLAGGTGTSAYIPTSSQFTTYTVNINAVASSHNVMFRWEFIPGSVMGNNLYIDDINISSNVAGIEQYANTNEQLSIYPNPTASSLQVISRNTQITQLQITDLLGNEIMQAIMQQGKAIIDVSNLASGVYFIKTNQGLQKFIKQ